jgi:hypothetical protein
MHSLQSLLISVAMAREKDEIALHDAHYRRDFLTYDNQLLDGEIFLQVQAILIIKPTLR